MRVYSEEEEEGGGEAEVEIKRARTKIKMLSARKIMIENNSKMRKNIFEIRSII